MRYRNNSVAVPFSFIAAAMVGVAVYLIHHNQERQVYNDRSSLMGKASHLAQEIERVQYSIMSDLDLLAEDRCWRMDSQLPAKVAMTRFFLKYRYMLEELVFANEGGTVLSLTYEGTLKRFSEASTFGNRPLSGLNAVGALGSYLGHGIISLSTSPSQDGEKIGRLRAFVNTGKMIQTITENTYLEPGVIAFALDQQGQLTRPSGDLRFPDEKLLSRLTEMVKLGYAGDLDAKAEFAGEAVDYVGSIAPIRISGQRFAVGLAIDRSRILETSVRTNLIVVAALSAFLLVGGVLYLMITRQQRRHLKDTTESRDRLESLLSYSQRRSGSSDQMRAILEAVQAIIRRSSIVGQPDLTVWLRNAPEDGSRAFASYEFKGISVYQGARSVAEALSSGKKTVGNRPPPHRERPPACRFESTHQCGDDASDGKICPATNVLCPKYDIALEGNTLFIPLISDMNDDEIGLIRITNLQMSEQEIKFAKTLSKYLSVWLANMNYAVSLEAQVDERTRQLSERGRDMRSILSSINQGIFTIERDLTLGGEYSGHLKALLGTDIDDIDKGLKGRKFEEILFDRALIRKADRRQAQSVVLSAMGETALSFAANEHHLPKQLAILTAAGKKDFEIDWDPIFNGEGRIEKIMVAMRDMTEIEAVKAENEEQKARLTVLHEAMSMAPRRLSLFICDAEELLERVGVLTSTIPISEGNLAQVYRDLHTLKGNSLAMGLTALVDAAHEAEEYVGPLCRLRLPLDVEKLDRSIQAIGKALDRYRYAFRAINPGSDQTEAYQEISSILIRHFDKPESDSRAVLERVTSVVRDAGSVAIGSLIADQVDPLSRISGLIGKPRPTIEFIGSEFRIGMGTSKRLSDILGHLFRNSLDHGIEFPQERVDLGKPPEGRIFVESRWKCADSIEIEVWDDGGGLDLGAMRRKAREMGLVREAESDESVADLVFAASLSTKSTTTEISGRGVGLDAVRALTKALDGSIRVRFRDDGDDAVGSDRRSFSLLLQLPGALVTWKKSDLVDPG